MDNLAILSQEGFAFLSRWAHFLAGITWIGLLYYFNFIQAPAVAQMGDSSRSDITRYLVPRALWWFRWAALFTVVSGLMILGFNELFTREYFSSVPGALILSGAILGIIMFSNVWLVIWPAQQIVIASAEAVADGGDANPAAAPAGRRALLASRANTLFSIPLLFFMGAATHLPGFSDHFELSPGQESWAAWWVIYAIVIGAIELNALGVFFGYAPHWSKAPFDSVRNVIISGFVLLAGLYLIFEILFQQSIG